MPPHTGGVAKELILCRPGNTNAADLRWVLFNTRCHLGVVFFQRKRNGRATTQRNQGVNPAREGGNEAQMSADFPWTIHDIPATNLPCNHPVRKYPQTVPGLPASIRRLFVGCPQVSADCPWTVRGLSVDCPRRPGDKPAM